MTEKRKRMLLIMGGVVASAGLLLAIMMKTGTSHQEDIIGSKAEEKGQVVVKLSPEQYESDLQDGEDEKEDSEEQRKNLVIQPEPAKDAGEQAGHPSDSRPPQTDQPEQSIQLDPTKPAEPEENVLKNPAQKPDGTVLTEPPVSVPHDQVGNPEETKPQPDGPQAGDTNGSQIYIPGFGWVENQGGGGSGISAGDMYENGNKIGVMD